MNEADYPCKHRGGLNEHGRYACALVPGRITAPLGVTLEVCSGCWYRDKDLEPLPEEEQQQQPQPQPQTFAQRAARFMLAMKDEVAWRAGGGAAPTTEEKAARRAACDACEHRDEEADGCQICGCYLEKGLLPPRPFGKLDCSTQSCPLNPPKWGHAGGYQPPVQRGCCG